MRWCSICLCVWFIFHLVYCCCKLHDFLLFFLSFSDTPLYIYIKFSLFIHSSIDRHLVYFYILTIVITNGAVNTRVYLLRSWWQFLWLYTRKEIAGSHSTAIFVFFWEPSILCSRMAVPIYILPTVYQSFLCSTFSPTFFIFLTF